MASDGVRQYVPLTCHGHSRPVPHIGFSPLTKDDMYYMISACKGELHPRQPAASLVFNRPLTTAQTTTPCFVMERLEIGTSFPLTRYPSENRD